MNKAMCNYLRLKQNHLRGNKLLPLSDSSSVSHLPVSGKQETLEYVTK